MTYASYSFQGEQPDRLGAPDGATPPADSLSGSLRVILELLLNAAQHLAAPHSAAAVEVLQEHLLGFTVRERGRILKI